MNKQRKSVIDGNEISVVESVNIGGYPQKILIEGKTSKLPILLCLHGGPGQPVPFSVGCRGLFPEITDKFIMVCWDQLGSGINNRPIDDSFTIDSFVLMTTDLIKLLKQRFPENKLYIFGFSWGTILSLKASLQIPDLIDGVVAYGQVLKELSCSEETYNALMSSAASEKMKAKFTAMYNKESYTVDDIKTSSGWVRKYTDGAVNKASKQAPMGDIIKGLITSPDYKFKDFKAIMINGYLKNKSLFTELMHLDIADDLSKVTLPYYIYQGSSDLVALTKTASEVVSSSKNKNLSCTIIENCGHVPSEKAMNEIINKILSLA